MREREHNVSPKAGNAAPCGCHPARPYTNPDQETARSDGRPEAVRPEEQVEYFDLEIRRASWREPNRKLSPL